MSKKEGNKCSGCLRNARYVRAMQDVLSCRERLWGASSKVLPHLVHHGKQRRFYLPQGVLGCFADWRQERLDLLVFLAVEAIVCHVPVPVDESHESRALPVGADGQMRSEGEHGGENDLQNVVERVAFRNVRGQQRWLHLHPFHHLGPCENRLNDGRPFVAVDAVGVAVAVVNG